MSKITLMAGLLAASAASANAGLIVNGSGGSIPDGDGTSFTSVITGPAGGAAVTGFVVIIQGLQHSWLGHLTISLTHQLSGTTVFLARKVGTTTGVGPGKGVVVNGDYTFSDSTGADLKATAMPLSSGSLVDPGAYRAAGTNGVFSSFGGIVGQSASSDWTLTIRDDVAGPAGVPAGSITGWSLDITLVPTPGAAGLAGIAGLVFAGRRRR